jgi:hypothetical protein
MNRRHELAAHVDQALTLAASQLTAYARARAADPYPTNPTSELRQQLHHTAATRALDLATTLLELADLAGVSTIRRHEQAAHLTNTLATMHHLDTAHLWTDFRPSRSTPSATLPPCRNTAPSPA